MDLASHASFISKPLNQDESRLLFERCAKGDHSARERIIMAYLPIALKICRKYERKGVAFDDLFQEACYGLILALDKYDYCLGTSFASYAIVYIEKYIKKAIHTQNVFRPIVYKEDFFYELQKYLRILDEQTEKLKRTPTDQELAHLLETTENHIRKLSQSVFSFFPVHDLVVGSSDYANNPSLNTYEEPESCVMHQILDLSCLDLSLTRREQEVLSRCLGFTASGVPESFSEIASSMGLTHETIRKTYDKVIKDIRRAVEDRGYTISTLQV